MSGQFGFQTTDPLPPLPLRVRCLIEIDDEFDPPDSDDPAAPSEDKG